MAVGPLSVSDAVELAKGTIDSLPRLTVTGEVSGFRGPHYRTGHCYFTLKDERSAMDAIVWRSTYAKLGFELKDGMEVVARGSFNVFGRTGRLSFNASSLSVAGEGMLRQKVARRAKRLAAEGLMADEVKRPVPEFCERVALVTSFSGSVRADVLRTLARRNPMVRVDMVACAVQGVDAPASIVRALAVAERARPAAILLVRGGGSFEDLMAFNDEGVARAIAALKVPVVTGIGHEPDVTIADMVADRRQSTPTAAAESVAPTCNQLMESLDNQAMRLSAEVQRRLDDAQAFCETFGERLPHSLLLLLERYRERLAALEGSKALRSPESLTQDARYELQCQKERMAIALPRGVARQKELLSAQVGRFLTVGAHLGERERHQLEGLAATLKALSPWSVLERGYAIVQQKDGGVVSRASQVQLGEELQVLLGEGSLTAWIMAIDDEGKPTGVHERT